MEATAVGPGGGWGAPGRWASANDIPAASASATAAAAAKRRRLFMWGRILGRSKKADLFTRIGAGSAVCKRIVLRIAGEKSRWKGNGPREEAIPPGEPGVPEGPASLAAV